MHANTLIAAPLNPRLRCDVGAPTATPLPSRQFEIKSADCHFHRHSANLLIKQRYGWRGYQTVSLPADQTSNRITLTATEDERTIGTITIGLDGSEGMACEDVFGPELAAMRSRGLRLCEFTKLAVDPVHGTKRVLAALFHVAYIVAFRVRGFDALVMEVNPRHVRFYERMLGAQVVGAERQNRHVDAPAVLLSIAFTHIAAMIERFAGRLEQAVNERSLYPFAFTRKEEAGILARLMTSQGAAPTAVN